MSFSNILFLHQEITDINHWRITGFDLLSELIVRVKCIQYATRKLLYKVMRSPRLGGIIIIYLLMLKDSVGIH